MGRKKTLLQILGLSSAEIRGEAFVLILAEADGGPRRIPVVLGRPEAQAIAMALEDVQTERPTTHDLFVSFAHAFGIRLTQMTITRFEEGVYYSELNFEDEDGERKVSMDSRTSDAIAIALRTGIGIYASEQVMDTAGFVLPHPSDDEDDEDDEDSNSEETLSPITSEEDDDEEDEKPLRKAKPENYSIEELERTLDRLVRNEDYEEAERINAILERKRRENNERER